jgi:hypothetical protein
MEAESLSRPLRLVSDPPLLMGVWKGYLYYIDSHNHFKHFGFVTPLKAISKHILIGNPNEN